MEKGPGIPGPFCFPRPFGPIGSILFYVAKSGLSALRAWTVGSRIRYALVLGVVNVAIIWSVLFLVRLPDGNAAPPFSYVALATVGSILVQGLLGYPRAKRRLTTPNG
jgi:hypothetical protein